VYIILTGEEVGREEEEEKEAGFFTVKVQE
jgi:hypothetical protein